MDRTNDFNSFSSYDLGFDPNISEMYKDPIFSPMAQYEQAYMYYKCMCMQLDYKIKCKEYENLCTNTRTNTKSETLKT